MQIEMDKLMELGSRLKAKRRGMGLEREEVAIKLKVSARTLHAIEEAISDSLPQPVFAKGFARSYAEELGMYTDEISDLISQAFPMELIDNVKVELSSTAREQAISINQASNTKLLAVIIPLCLLVLGAGGWFLFNTFILGEKTPLSVIRPSSQAGQVRPVPGPEPAQPDEAQQAAPEGEGQAEPQSPAADGAGQSGGPAPAQAATPPAAQPEATRNLNLPPNQVAQSNARADSPIPSGAQRVVLFAKYECWIGAEFDATGKRSFTLEAGQTFVLDFKQHLTLTLGNAGAIDMSYNGKPYETGGRFREAKVLAFPPQ